jgi:hypothetical protein
MNNHRYSIRDRVQHRIRQQVLAQLREGVDQDPRSWARVWAVGPQLRILQIEADIQTRLSQEMVDGFT